MKFRSFTHRLLFGFIVVGFLPLVFFGILSLYQNEVELKKESLNIVSRLADKKNIQIKTYISERIQDIELLAQTKIVERAILELSNPFQPNSSDYQIKIKPYNERFSNYIDSNSSTLFYDILLITPQGEIIYTYRHETDFATNLNTGLYQNTGLSKVFHASLMQLESSVSEFELYEPSRKSAAFIATPILRNGVLIGVLALQLDSIQLIKVAVDNTGLGKTAETVLAKLTDIDKAVFIVKQNYTPDAAIKETFDLKTSSLPMRSALLGNRGSGIEVDYSGKKVFAAWRYLPELHLGMVVKVDADELLAPIYNKRIYFLELLFGVIFFSAIIAYFFSRQIIKRIQNFVEVSNEIANGKLGKKVDDSESDEIGILGRTFNHMSEKLQALYGTLEARVEERTQELEVTNEQLHDEVRQKELRELELLKFQAIIDSTDDAVISQSLDGIVQSWNHGAEIIFGYSASEMIGKPMKILCQMDNQNEEQEILSHICTGEKIEHFESVRKRKDGALINISATISPIFNLNEIVIGMSKIIRDITMKKKFEVELERKQELLNEAQHLGKLGSWELNLVKNELIWSDEIYKIFELNPEEFDPSYEKFLSVIHPNDREMVNQAYTKSLDDKKQYSIEHRLLLANGKIKWVREQCSSYFDESGKPLKSIGAVQDITDQKKAQENLRVASVAFETHEAILITNTKVEIIKVNQAFTEITGFSPENVLGKNPKILSSGRHDKAFYKAMWHDILFKGSWTGEIWDRRKNGQIYPKWLTITAVKNDMGETTEYVGIFSDITARKQAEEEIRNLAFYDALTKLPNRRLLLDRLSNSLTTSIRSNNYCAVLFLDMDKFKTLNDTLGHFYGDMLLIEVSERIKSCIREKDTVARLGGDEFVVLIEEIDSNMEQAAQKIAIVAEKIRKKLNSPYQLLDHEYLSSPSIGVNIYRNDSGSVDDILKHADMAMYQAKDSGRNAVRFFDPLMQKTVETRAAFELDLRHALPENQLFLYYQLQVDQKNQPIGAEALLRWIHPQRGSVSPAQFIPVAEESSLILEIGYWVIDEACRQLSKWSLSDKTKHLTMAVNVSAKQFRLTKFVDYITNLIHTYEINPNMLKLELTESIIMSDIKEVVIKMNELRKIGVKLSLDDFGTGYSSLSYLKQLPLDQLKIDQSFVRDIATDPNDAVMVKTIINLAQNFKLDIIAEGVETNEQLNFLKQHGCNAYQGYFFAKPIPIEEFEKLL
ncbi:MAG: EAL domain-containing protein [Spirochaetia bacterium]|nr:EAL domain-containing protein [Spirochaetia bacterium]